MAVYVVPTHVGRVGVLQHYGEIVHDGGVGVVVEAAQGSKHSCYYICSSSS